MNTSSLSRLWHRALQAFVVSAVIATAVAPVPAMAATLDTFMKIDGLPGESTSAQNPNEIVLSGWSQNFGTRQCSRAVATKRVDRSSPGLIARAAANTTIPQVLVSMTRGDVGGGRPVTVFRATLDQVQIDRVEIVEVDEELVERVVLAARSIRIEYWPIQPNGAPGTPVATAIACAAHDR